MKKGYMDTLSSKKIIKDQSLLRHEDIRHQIRVLPELEALIPPLLPDELEQLETNIRKDGCREALLVWETTEGALKSTTDSTPVYILIDGHNRYGICQRNSLDFRVNLRAFVDMNEVRTFMIENQLGRRNLTPEQTAYLRGLRYRAEKSGRGKYDRTMHKGQIVPYAQDASLEASETASEAVNSAERESTAKRIAKRFNVNEKTIKRDAEFAAGIEKLTPSLKSDVLTGKVSVNKANLQELGKSNVPDGSIDSLNALPTVSVTSTPTKINAKPAPIKRTVKNNPKTTQAELQVKLKTLADKLSNVPVADVALCDELVACATNLKAILLENQ